MSEEKTNLVPSMEEVEKSIVSLEQSMLEQYISDITENPLNYFQLKKEVGVIGETGLYVKNIKVEDFDLNTDLLKQLREKHY